MGESYQDYLAQRQREDWIADTPLWERVLRSAIATALALGYAAGLIAVLTKTAVVALHSLAHGVL